MNRGKGGHSREIVMPRLGAWHPRMCEMVLFSNEAGIQKETGIRGFDVSSAERQARNDKPEKNYGVMYISNF
jgi:hypothetical protein